MIETLQREAIYFWYYFSVPFEQIVWYWAAGMLLGSAVSVFLMAATIGVPLYACGGGTIPLLQAWLTDGMSMGSACAFMVTGPATKITNLGAVKIILGWRKFVLYWLFIIGFACISGLFINSIL